MKIDIPKKIELIAKKNKKRVGIGVSEPTKRLISLSESAKEFADVVLVGDEYKIKKIGCDLEIKHTKNPEKDLIGLLLNGELDAAVRGNLKSSETLFWLKKGLNLDKIYRIALLQTSSKKTFFLAPIGIDEGENASDKIEIIKRVCELLKKLEIEPNVGVLSGGRFGDVGRSDIVDKSLEDAEYITKKVKEKKIHAKNYQILIEEAIKEANIIIAPDGISGNLVFRTLVFLGGGIGFGAPVLMDKMVFVDTSRASQSYGRAIMFASALHGVSEI